MERSILTIGIFLFSLTASMAQPRYLPGTCKEFNWVNDNWEYEGHVITKYDSKGMVTEQYIVDSVSGDTLQGTLTTYLDDNDVDVTYKKWDTATKSLVNSTRYVTKYDEHGNFTLYEYYNWDGSKWVIQNYSQRVNYTFDMGVIKEGITEQYNNGNWKESVKQAFFFTGNVLDSIITYSSDGMGGWKKNSKKEYEVTSPKKLKRTSYLWQGTPGMWAKSSRTYLTYLDDHNVKTDSHDPYMENDRKEDSVYALYWNGMKWMRGQFTQNTFMKEGENDVTTSIEKFYDTTSKMYINTGKSFTKVDKFGNYLLNEGFNWDTNKNDWVKSYGIKEINKYEGALSKLLEVVQQIYDVGNDEYVNDYKRVYSDFTVLNAVSIDNSILSGKIKVYPNPSNGILRVNLPSNNSYDLTVTNINGAIISEQRANSSTATLDMTQQQRGIYLLIVSNQREKAVYRIVLQ